MKNYNGEILYYHTQSCGTSSMTSEHREKHCAEARRKERRLVIGKFNYSYDVDSEPNNKATQDLFVLQRADNA